MYAALVRNSMMDTSLRMTTAYEKLLGILFDIPSIPKLGYPADLHT